MDSASVSLLQSPPGSENQKRDPNTNVFGNSVIWRKMSEYFELEDFLKLRIANRFFYDLVSDCESFKNKISIHMTDEAIRDRDFLDFLGEFPKWNSLSVTLCDTKHRNKNLMAVYYPIIFKAEVKQLKCYWEEGRRRPNSRVLGSVIFDLITQMPQMAKLEIEFALLARIEFWGAKIRSQEILKNVTDFKIFQGPFTHLRYGFPTSVFQCNMRLFEISFSHLKNLTIEEVPDFAISTMAKAHLLIRNNCSTLESLVILYPALWHKTRMSQIICPKLKRIEAIVKVGHYQDTFFKAFIKNQPPLESISLSVVGNLDDDILSIIQYKHSRNLKSLHIKAHEIEDRTFPFQFLSSTGLLEFSLIMPRRTGPRYEQTFGIEECETLLQYLPSTIQKLKLGGLQLRPTSKFSYNRLHFSRLTSCELLTTLEFVDCKGLSGNRFWIRDLCGLKGLQQLTISHLSLTDGDILSLKFATLKSLDVSGNKLLSRVAVQRMVSQNPSLEVLTCSQYGIQKCGKLTKIVIQELDLWTSSDSDDQTV